MSKITTIHKVPAQKLMSAAKLQKLIDVLKAIAKRCSNLESDAFLPANVLELIAKAHEEDDLAVWGSATLANKAALKVAETIISIREDLDAAICKLTRSTAQLEQDVTTECEVAS